MRTRATSVILHEALTSNAYDDKRFQRIIVEEMVAFLPAKLFAACDHSFASRPGTHREEGGTRFMHEHDNRSDIARLRQRIAEEYEAATRGLTGLATGFATHQFITQRMEHIGAYHEALQHLVGEQEAIRIVAETLEAVQAAPGGMHEL